MGTALTVQDRLENVVAHLAWGKSKAIHDHFTVNEISPNELMNMYRGDWMARKIIELPVEDALNTWREWELKPDQIKIIEEAEERHQVETKLWDALTWGRLFGGAAILISVKGEKDVTQPLGPIGKGRLQALTVLNRWEIAPDQPILDPSSNSFRQPEFYMLGTGDQSGLKVHHSRVIRCLGAPRPDAQYTDGWSDSTLMAVYEAIHHAALTTGGIAELIHEAKIDIVKIPGLDQYLGDETGAGTRMLQKRFGMAKQLKSINNMLLLGGEEEYDQKQTSFAGLPDVLRGYLQIVAGASGIPATRLLGEAPGGLNATGDGDLRNYHKTLKSYQKRVIRPILKRIDSVLWQDATGAEPKDAYWKFGPLGEMTEKEMAEIENLRADRDKKYVDMGLFPQETLADIVGAELVENATYSALENSLAKLRSAIASEVEKQEEAAASEAAIAQQRIGARIPARV